MKPNDQPSANRRTFLRTSTAVAATAMATPLLASSSLPLSVSATSGLQSNTEAKHRIRKLGLQTAIPLPKMAEFYKTVLEMNVQLTEDKLIIDGGQTQISFVPAENGTKPYYHFAFNIPENKILSARKWLGEKTELAITPPQLRDKDFPNEVRPFDFWNSHSLFFWDPAGNILELICRHDLKNATQGEFRSEDILYASEIGMVAEGTVNKLASQIKSTFQLSQYRGGGDDFRAIGDETGLLILFGQGGTPVGAKPGQRWNVFPTEVSIQPDIVLDHDTLPHKISSH